MLEEASSVTMLTSILSVILFCASCFCLLREVRKPVPLFNQTAFSKAALRVGKAYKVTAWAVLMAVFLGSLVISFIEVYTRL